MGIVNVTPDSFSDGGRFFSPEEAIRRARNMIDDGADIIDLGGESTRPGATPLSWDEEWSRIEPVVKGLRQLSDETVISVDTYHPETAERAVAAGINIINCVYPEPVPDMLRLLVNNSVELVLPCRMADFANERETGPLAWRKFASRVYLDPMVGFGTTREEDIDLLRSVPDLARQGRVLVGASRKRIVKKLTGEKVTGKNLGGNLSIAVWCALQGASIVRVHDVRETVQALKVVDALRPL